MHRRWVDSNKDMCACQTLDAIIRVCILKRALCAWLSGSRQTSNTAGKKPHGVNDVDGMIAFQIRVDGMDDVLEWLVAMRSICEGRFLCNLILAAGLELSQRTH